jgi:protein-tyrosine phosphatase
MSSVKYRLAGVDSASTPDSGYWVVPNLLLAGPYPGAIDPVEHHQKIRSILNVGIRTFVNLMRNDETDHENRPFVPYDDLIGTFCPGATFIRFPISDLGVPTVAEMGRILETIDSSLDLGNPVYVHCWGGVGRTGTVVGCWLLQHGLATPENYIDTMFALRRRDPQRWRRISPETEIQRRFVRQWLSSGAQSGK